LSASDTTKVADDVLTLLSEEELAIYNGMEIGGDKVYALKSVLMYAYYEREGWPR
jgi:hypothetical protein